MAKVFIEEATLTGIADAIREKEGTTELIPPLEMPARIEAISGGLALETKARIIQFPTLNIFDTKEVTLNLTSVVTLAQLFFARTNDQINTTVEHLTINCPNAIESMQYFINGYNDKTLKKITLNVDTAEADSLMYAFSANTALEHIEGTPLDFSSLEAGSSLNHIFNKCRALREVRFKGTIKGTMGVQESKDFSKESTISLMSCLSTVAVGMTLTLNKEAVNKAFETSEGAADGSESAEWLALVEAHSNWTIALWED